jgi:SAM-dependent methyltransferase
MTASGSEFLRHNQAAWNRLVQAGSQFARAVTDSELANPLDVLDGRGWLPATVQGLDVLCLAAAGGWQSILYAAAGARVTVVDISDDMLAIDSREAEKRQLQVDVVQASMDDLSALRDEAFDIVHQPVSTCYVPSLEPVFREVARVLRDDGLYVSQHKQPASLQVSHRDRRDRYVVGIEYYHEGPLPDVPDQAYREQGTVEFLHRWEELVGTLCQAGFVIEDLREPLRADRTAQPGDFRHRGRFFPPYVRIKARRRQRAETKTSNPLWTPKS